MEERVFISQLGFISEHVSWLSFTGKKSTFCLFSLKKEHFFTIF